MQETWVQSLGWEDPLEEGTAIHSSILAWKIPWTEEPGRLQSMGSQSQTWLSNFHFQSYFSSWSDQIRSVAQLCPTLCNTMDRSTPGLPVHHQLPEFAQTHVHRVSDALQPSHPLSSPSPPAFNLSQHQGLFQWVSSLHQVAKVLEFQLQHQSFQRNLRAGSPRDSQESSPTPQFKSINSLALSFLYSLTLTSIHDHRKNHSLD